MTLQKYGHLYYFDILCRDGILKSLLRVVIPEIQSCGLAIKCNESRKLAMPTTPFSIYYQVSAFSWKVLFNKLPRKMRCKVQCNRMTVVFFEPMTITIIWASNLNKVRSQLGRISRWTTFWYSCTLKTRLHVTLTCNL